MRLWEWGTHDRINVFVRTDTRKLAQYLWGQKEKVTICKPREFPPKPGLACILISEIRLQKYENINIFCLSHPFNVFTLQQLKPRQSQLASSFCKKNIMMFPRNLPFLQFLFTPRLSCKTRLTFLQEEGYQVENTAPFLYSSPWWEMKCISDFWFQVFM